MNTQAFRNWMFTRGCCADAAMELYFRNTKGIKEESSELKKGTIHESLSRLFTFQTIRVAHVARELANLLGKNKFMDCDPPKEDTWVKSTLHRWKDQVTVASCVHKDCTLCMRLKVVFLQVDLIPNCTLQRSIGDYYVVLETVNKQGPHMLEAVTRVHIVCMAGFEFKDSDTNVRIMRIFNFYYARHAAHAGGSHLHLSCQSKRKGLLCRHHESTSNACKVSRLVWAKLAQERAAGQAPPR
jgi:hypothetical protein